MAAEWVPVMAPPELAPRFLREVAAYVAAASKEEQGGPRLWEDAAASDIAAFLAELNAAQRELVVELAFSSTPRTAAVLAERVGKTIDDVAGLVGPINKRAKKLGWTSPIRSHRHANGTTKDKVVVLDDHVALWVRNHHEENDQ
ncbi:MAG: hypothetical protein KY439_01220 [Actinobacteria bacterium]|nr:hypothetical protein [Actinomycetota bacterium]